MPSQSLTDEIEALAQSCEAALLDRWKHGSMVNRAALLRARYDLRSRLQEIEKELTELRGMKETLVGWANMKELTAEAREDEPIQIGPGIWVSGGVLRDMEPTGMSFVPKEWESMPFAPLERTPALPCSNTIEELGDESGG